MSNKTNPIKIVENRMQNAERMKKHYASKRERELKERWNAISKELLLTRNLIAMEQEQAKCG